MTLERLFIAIIVGFVMAGCVYWGLFRPQISKSYRWLAISFSALLYLCSLSYLAFLHQPKCFTQNFSIALGILFLLFCASIPSLLILGICKLIAPKIIRFFPIWATGLSMITCVSIVYALLQALQPPKLYTQSLTLPNLSIPLRVLQISDLHIGGSYLTNSKLQKIIEQSNATSPDLILLTGDIVDAPSQSVLSSIKLLGDLKAKYGVFYALGNHEYFYDTNNILQELSKLGIKTLVNENYILSVDSKPILNIAGIADFNASKYQKLYPNKSMIFPDMQKILNSLNPNLPSILLSHQPKVIASLPSPSPFALIFSGHTHGGQIFPFNYLIKLEQPFVKGLHSLNDGQIYINQGTAFWGIPMRLGSECELTLFEIK